MAVVHYIKTQHVICFLYGKELGTTVVLSWHVQTLVVIWYPMVVLHQNQFPSNLNYDRTISCKKNGPWADVKTGLKFGEVMHSTMKHCRRCCCLSGVDSQVSGGDVYASGLSAEFKAPYCLRDTRSSDENRIKIKSNKHRDILYSDSNFIEVWSQVSSWHYFSIAPSNGLAPNRRQAII